MAICKDNLTFPLPMRYAAPAMQQLTLQQIPIGGYARITGYVRGDRELRDRMLSFGLTRGATIQIVRTAPTGCPFELRVRDMSVVLRRSEANGLYVEPVSAP